ncbi:conserved hypothetical protein (plasmid) [Bacillus cereus biovar anthracis str. CI]|nr:conserved hypothetical protein [Bacillus cereus biovar anthracis str. CI]
MRFSCLFTALQLLIHIKKQTNKNIIVVGNKIMLPKLVFVQFTKNRNVKGLNK